MIRTHIRIAHIASIRTGSPVDSRQCDWGIIAYILFEAAGKTIHDFCEHTYAHQWEFQSTSKLKLRKNAKLLVNMWKIN